MPDRTSDLRPLRVVAAISGTFLLASPARAGNCQEDVDALRKEIKQDKEKFKKDALDDALSHLRKAEFHRINPVECRQEVMAARAALTKGRKYGEG